MDPDCDIRSFGSFATGVYLPTADMDLVCVTRQFLATGMPKLGQKARNLNSIAHFLRQKGLAERNAIEVIAKAKVPILKFTDALTGIRVDISFENTTGLVAIETCLTWKAQYPAMPILVLLIKQFLMMRGLHEVRDGGLGGFSVICLVTSLLQTMPQVQSRSMIPEQHLGDILMEFLDLYGNRFNLATTGIRFYPPGYFEKVSVWKTSLSLNMTADITLKAAYVQPTIPTKYRPPVHRGSKPAR
jgi:non-canonical poly(A) RNA polymerase PAPD5/7